jgi:hypothetical protein
MFATPSFPGPDVEACEHRVAVCSRQPRRSADDVVCECYAQQRHRLHTGVVKADILHS